MVDCPDLIKEYISRKRIKKIVLPEPRECKITEETVPFDCLTRHSQKQILNIYEPNDCHKRKQHKKQKESRYNIKKKLRRN